VFYLDLASKRWITLTNLTQPRIFSTMEYVNGMNKILALLPQWESIIPLEAYSNFVLIFMLD
jgi:hypothetical protein